MLYFKHSELVNNYHVSLKTVHNWIDAAKQGKLELQLHEHNGRTYVANTPGNVLILQRLAEKGKKYRNTLHHKVVSPKAEFYTLYSPRQILDIISNLNVHREIPRQYNYFNGGANNWDQWLQRLSQEPTSNILKSTIKLMHDNLDQLDLFLKDYEKVNVIDVGVGNAMPAQELLGHLLKQGKINRYVAIDISESMLKIAEENVQGWFDGQIKFEGHIRDISYERFDDLLVDELLDEQQGKIVNVVLLFGATPSNFRDPSDALRTIYGSIGDDDLLIYSDKADTESSRRYFDFGHSTNIAPRLSPNHRFILDLMNIDESLYDIDMGFSREKRMRYIRIRLNSALTIRFKANGNMRDVSFEKGETILLLRVWHQTVLELIGSFERAGFLLLQASLTKDREYLLTISGVNKDLGNDF